MKIAIIGAGIAGLVAGRELTLAGHEVIVIEKGRTVGGRLSTVRLGKEGPLADNGVSWVTANRPEFRPFASDLIERDLLDVWGDHIDYYDGEQKLSERPPFLSGTLYAAPKGAASIAGDLSKWVDIEEGERAIGLTFIGDSRRKKRAWMVNLASSRTIEADAVLVATPAPEAYGVLLTTQDEVDVLKMIREIDSIHYEASIALSVQTGIGESPDWEAVICQDADVREITHEGSKRSESTGTYTVISTDAFARKHKNQSIEEVRQILWDRVSALTGLPRVELKESSMTYWPFHKPKSVLNVPYLEFDHAEAPLAIVGDYFEGNDTESSFCSGLALARKWIEQFEEAGQPA
ncbi:MAG: NAD(P)/FAD-dependent oxidoreductase [Bacteroidota bacterium]